MAQRFAKLAMTRQVIQSNYIELLRDLMKHLG